MRHSTTVKQIISGKTERIWKTISQGGNLHKWFPIAVQSCKLEKVNEQTFRFCTMKDGSQLKERIIEVSDEAHRFTYTVYEHPLPASEILTSIEIENVGSESTSIIWSAEFVASEENISIVEKMLQEIFMQGIESLENWHRKIKD
ncbi:hypothetical protein NIES4106_59240 (plasmid) [Fischerella sp. NIES-4106]|nr:hypothetical protein NIES4106_59240 [Fischerella sp. NIES-4106]